MRFLALKFVTFVKRRLYFLQTVSPPVYLVMTESIEVASESRIAFKGRKRQVFSVTLSVNDPADFIKIVTVVTYKIRAFKQEV